MQKPVKKIGFIILLIIIVPALFISIYQYSSLNRDEILIEQIYKEQLSGVLFSVNQYSEDVVRSWKNEYERFLTLPKLKDSVFRKTGLVTIFQPDNLDSSVPSELRRILQSQNLPAIRSRLERYSQSNYYKIEPFLIETDKEHFYLAFFTGEFSPEKKFTLFRLNKNAFLRSVIFPRMSFSAGEQFVIAVTDSASGNILLSTTRTTPEELQVYSRLWMIPGINLGIRIQGQTILSLVKERTKSLFILLGISNLLILIGSIFLFRNINREVRLAQIKSDFVSNVSHELRTPLALIHMFAETLEMGRVKTDEKKNQYYTIIRQETERLSSIVNKILNFSQFEAGKRKYNFGIITVNEFVDSVLSSYRFHLEQKGFHLTVKLAEFLPKITGDKEALSEALINLLDNAMKYSTEIKEIVVETGKTSEGVFIAVTDKGIGISEDDKKKVFDKFYRVSKGNIHATKGTGLGLSIVKHIVDSHKGKIELESTQGKGSTFKIILPAQ